ncbi:unnamed protein product [Peronospora belbahrii]|uniref:Protein kinase domain-containing protein n=1 Tax=Peronospora belbahrii TaxID=622444 RepID=A0ABN8CN16_9STRA|nr:unnamed protein product [Peronospora belbahrii]
MDNPWSEHRVVSRRWRYRRTPTLYAFVTDSCTKGYVVCVMEFCPGGDLWNLLEHAPRNRLPEVMAQQLFLQCVRGVQFLHAHGIAHRDLSLENVFYCRGVCKIGDFGLSTDAPLRGKGEVVGKAYYMAQEVVNQEKYDAAFAVEHVVARYHVVHYAHGLAARVERVA